MAPVAPARTTRLESLVPAATPNTSPETETAPSSIPKVMSPIATRDWDIKRRSAPTAACNIRNLQVRPTDPTLAAGLEHRPGRFLLFGVIVAMFWALLGVVLVVTIGQGRWWVLVVSDLSPPHGPQVGSSGEARQHMAVVMRRANVPCTNVPALTRAPVLCPHLEGNVTRVNMTSCSSPVAICVWGSLAVMADLPL